MKIYTIGGYEEIGKNMTAVEINNDIFIFDMGIKLDRVMIHEDTNLQDLPPKKLRKIGAIPDDSILDKKNVKAIILSHGHLDHIGAIPKMAFNYRCPIIGTKYTISLISSLIKEEPFSECKNQLIATNKNIEIGNYEIEFINSTHSIPETKFVALHSKEGTILYTGDFKLDMHPTIGKKPDFKKLKELNPKIMITDSTRAPEETKTPSEKVAVTMLQDFLLDSYDEKKGIVTTTFASHIARIKTLIDTAEKMDRIPILLGRSLCKYYGTALRLGIVKEKAKMIKRRSSIEKKLKEINKEKEKYLVITTGSQGEIDAVLSRIANKETPLLLDKGDTVLFSTSTIPHPINIANRYKLESKLKMREVRIIKDVHVSGHASKEDLRELLRIVNPENIIPTHGEYTMLASWAELGEEEGYRIEKDIFIRRNGQKVVIE
ncbi:MAG TPA: RNase J family beta-CASP ribonuclease [Methanomicrobia archaeon]|nr:RNase J family beta-CASP ribonuclease [Methanomicrobia archaeon]